MKRFKYINICSEFRHNKENEAFWQEMNNKKVKIDLDSVFTLLDFTNFPLDKDEEIDDFILNAEREDPTAGFYKSIVSDETVYFFYTAGFEYIFRDIKLNLIIGKNHCRNTISYYETDQECEHNQTHKTDKLFEWFPCDCFKHDCVKVSKPLDYARYENIYISCRHEVIKGIDFKEELHGTE